MPHSIKNRPIYFIILLFMGIALANPNDKKSISLNDIQSGTLVQKGEEPGQYYALPRLDTKVDLAIDGLVVSATVDQMFVNNSSEPIEAIYVFPLPDKAAVYDMVMIVNDRLIQSHVKEKKAAKKTYEKAKKANVNAKLEIWEDMFHGWHSNAHILKDAEDAIISIGKFCRNLLNQ